MPPSAKHHNAELERRWAASGAGIAYKSQLDQLPDWRASRLEALLPQYGGETAALYFICRHRLMLTPAVTALREMLLARLQEYAQDT